VQRRDTDAGASASDDPAPTRVARRARRATAASPPGDREHLPPASAARGALARDDAPIDDVQPPPYRTPSGACTDGVAALGLCSGQATSHGG
jgi:hypothetical protein